MRGMGQGEVVVLRALSPPYGHVAGRFSQEICHVADSAWPHLSQTAAASASHRKRKEVYEPLVLPPNPSWVLRGLC